MAHNDQYAGNHDFNPYSNPQPHAPYEEPTTGYENIDSNTAYQPGYKQADASSGFDREEFGSPRGEKAQNFGQYRRTRGYGYENAWTKGSRLSCVGRFFCCTLLIGIFILVSIVLALALWIRPPSVIIGTPGLTSAGTSAVQLNNTGITVPLQVNISVSNPNYFSVELKKVTLDLTYPLKGNDTAIGNGTKSDVTFHSHSNTSFTFPFDVNYQFSTDPTYAILLDMANKCGVTGGSQSDLKIDYKVTVDIKILLVSISPSISNTFSLSCPFDQSELESFVKSLGLSSILGSL